MPELMNHVEFRTALENAIKGKSANKAPFSIAWASGKLSRAHLARWAENHYHYVGPFADYLGYIYARMPEQYQEAKDFLVANMYEEEIGGDRHSDLLIRFAEACGTSAARVKNPDNMTPTTRSSRCEVSWSVSNPRCHSSPASRRRPCARNTNSPTRRWSSSTFTSS